MTQTVERPTTTGSPAERTDAWLAAFEDALTARDVDRAAGMFAATSFWRDLVAFTWNIKTLEGPAAIRHMLEHTLDHVRPRGFAATEPPASADGLTEAWIAFETETGRGAGHPPSAGAGPRPWGRGPGHGPRRPSRGDTCPGR